MFDYLFISFFNSFLPTTISFVLNCISCLKYFLQNVRAVFSCSLSNSSVVTLLNYFWIIFSYKNSASCNFIFYGIFSIRVSLLFRYFWLNINYGAGIVLRKNFLVFVAVCNKATLQTPLKVDTLMIHQNSNKRK